MHNPERRKLCTSNLPDKVIMDSRLALRAPRNDACYNAMPPSTRCGCPVM
jgi:hypothetical protein